MSLRNVTAEPSLPSSLPRLRPLPGGTPLWHSSFSQSSPQCPWPLSSHSRLLGKLIRSLRKEFEAATSTPGGWHPGCHREGPAQPWKTHIPWLKSIPRGFIWPQELRQAGGLQRRFRPPLLYLPVTKPCHSSQDWDKPMAPGEVRQGTHISPKHW